MTVDYEHDQLVVRRIDGSELRQRGGARWPSFDPSDSINFKRATFEPHRLLNTFVTANGDEFETEVFNNDNQMARRDGRPVLYLDQNKWVQVSKAVHRPDLVHPPELQPTLQLIELARARRLILPISGGHWVETGPLYGQRRTKLATLMVELSRGWVMRHPLQIRQAEVQALFDGVVAGGHAPKVDLEVFTLDGNTVLDDISPYEPRDTDMPSEVAATIQNLVGAQSVLAVLLENERTRSDAGAAAAIAWAKLHQDFATHLATEPATIPYRRQLTLYRFVADLGIEFPQTASASGVGSDEFTRWFLSTADQDIAQLPYLGLMREVIHTRLSSAYRWQRTDLVDLLFLPCAAAYADAVVCENHTGDDLVRATRSRSKSAIVTSTIADGLRRLNV